jgi:hypothetical protein
VASIPRAYVARPKKSESYGSASAASAGQV